MVVHVLRKNDITNPLTKQCLKEFAFEDFDDTLNGCFQRFVRRLVQTCVVILQEFQSPVGICKDKDCNQSMKLAAK
jgi:hypothetical protein